MKNKKPSRIGFGTKKQRKEDFESRNKKLEKLLSKGLPIETPEQKEKRIKDMPLSMVNPI